VDIQMPQLGETVTEGTITRWLKNVGDHVDADEPLFEVSTDKVDSEVPSPYDGVLLDILVPEGETVAVGSVLARIRDADATAVTREVGGGPPAPASAPGREAGADGSGAMRAGGNGRILSPLVRRLVAENGLDIDSITGTGASGRIRREDVQKAIAARASAPAPAPAVPAPAAVVTPAPHRPAGTPGEREEQVPLSRIRLAIADRMVESLRVAPHVWTSVEVDLEAVEKVRSRHKERFRQDEGASLTYLPFVARVLCDALRKFPNVNSSLDLESRTRTLHHYVNLAVAVDLNEEGLVAPVIRDADTMNLRGLARSIRAVAQKATSRSLSPDDLRGSTFTITNPGPIGDYASAPIINQPNSAILSTNMVSRRVTVVGDAIAIHHMTILGFSYDHRAFDGVTASRFLAYVRDELQERDWEAELA
jgi:pyruvate dehydrogenase E2 component (dihydrolipoamide acetyltransferase)